MNNFDDIFKKSFEEQSLENEQWLEPNDSVLDSIHNELEAGEEEKPKAFWIWPLGGLVIIGLFTSFLLFSNAQKATNASNIQHQANDSEFSKSATSEAEWSNASTRENLLARSTNVKEVKEVASVSPNNKEVLKPSIANIKEDNALSSKVENSLSPLKSSSIKNINTIEKSAVNFELKQQLLPGANEPVVLSEIASVHKPTLASAVVSKHENKNLIAKDKLFVEFLPLLNSSLNWSEEEVEIPNLPSIEIQKQNKASNAIQLSTGVIFWEDRLNTNYSAALSPAEFENGNDYGVQVTLSYQKKVFPRLSAGFNLGYAQVENQSGHNAVLFYEEDQETDQQNKYSSVTLATPYGFVESEFNIKRATNASESNVELNSSINSKHTLKMASLEATLNFEVFSISKFNLNIGGNFGYNHLLQINNNLDFIDTRHSEFSYGEGRITTDQGNLKNGFWSTGVGVDLTYKISPSSELGLNYSFKEALSPIFEANGFSSSPRMQQLGLIFKKKF